MKKIFLFTILLFGPFTLDCFAQRNKIDSLLILLKKGKVDTNKLFLLNKLSGAYKETGSYDSAMLYAKSALQLSVVMLRETIDPKTRLTTQKNAASSYIIIGSVNSNQSNYPEALKNYFAALKIREAIGDKNGIASSYNNIGLVYCYQGNYSDALKNHVASLKIKEALGDKAGIARSYSNIGLVYSYQGNYPDALINHFAALKIREALGEKSGKADSYNNIGIIYYAQGNYTESLKNYMASLKIRELIGDKMGIATSYNNIGTIYYSKKNYLETLKNYFASLKIRIAIGDKNGIADSYNNIGIVYFDQKNYPEALKKYFASLKIREEIGNSAGITASYNNIGNVFTKQKKYKEAEEFLVKAKELSKKIGYKEYLRDAYSGLVYLDSSRGNFKGAYENHKLYVLYRDSIDNDETRKKTLQLQLTSDFEKKEAITRVENEKQQAIAEEKSRKQKYIIRIVLGGLMLVLILAGFIFRSLRMTRKQKNIIEGQKNEVSHQKEIADSQRIIAEELREISEKQKHIVEQKQKEIVDSITYAKRIQMALLTSDEYIKNNLLGEYFILFKPKDIVSGDFYWAYRSPNHPSGIYPEHIEEGALGKGLFYIATADCTGHGVPGAFMSMLNISYLNENVIEKGLCMPSDILDAQRKEIIKALNPKGSKEVSNDGMDCILCVYDFEQMLLYFSAANNPLWLVRNGELTEYKADKMPVGKYNENMLPFTLQIIELQKDDIIYTSTDGYADQFGLVGKKLMKKAFKEELLKIHKQPMTEQKEYLNRFFENWKGGSEQVDDVCVIGIKI